MLVSIVVPAYKKEKTIRQDIENICNVMDHTRWDYEVIVVVDGFLDNTFEEVSKIKRDNVQVVGYKRNHGKGHAVRYGMRHAVGDVVSFIDAGMDIDASGISMLLEHMAWYDADVIVGSKRHPVSQVDYPLLRRIYSWGYHTLVRLFFGIRLRDTQTGLKVYRREVLEKVLPRLVVKQFAFDIEMLAVAKHIGFARIYEAPVKVTMDFNASTFDKFLFLDPNIRKMLLDTLAIFYRLHFLKYYADDNAANWQKFEKVLDSP